MSEKEFEELAEKHGVSFETTYSVLCFGDQEENMEEVWGTETAITVQLTDKIRVVGYYSHSPKSGDSFYTMTFGEEEVFTVSQPRILPNPNRR